MGFVTCVWKCAQCSKRGLMKPWRRESETRDDVARRTSQQTRTACVPGCAFVADADWTAVESATAADAVDPVDGMTG